MKTKIAFSAVIISTIGVAAACAYAVWIGDFGIWSFLFYALMLLSFPLSSALHECGHILIGAIVKLNAKPHFAFFGSSFCRIVPRAQTNLRARAIAVSCGGLSVNLLCMALGVVMLCVGGNLTFVGAILPASFYIFALNALPLCYRDGKTDGLVICELIREEDTAKVMLAVLKAQAQILSGTPIAEIDKALLFDLPQIREDDVNFYALTSLRAEYFAATGEEEKALAARERLKQLEVYFD